MSSLEPQSVNNYSGPIEKTEGSKSNAEIHDSTGKILAIVGFGIACIALGASVTSMLGARDTRSELVQLIAQSENRVLADNREKTTAFNLLDSHVKELQNMVKVQEKVNERGR